MAKPKSDPLLAALIAKLPDDKDWPVERQLAWLNLMAMAFGAVYGGDAAARLKAEPYTPLVLDRRDVLDMRSVNPPAPKPKPKPTFYVDVDNYARKTNGDRIVASEVHGPLVDLRGLDGDMKTIIWADDSTGLNGRDLPIMAG